MAKSPSLAFMAHQSPVRLMEPARAGPRPKNFGDESRVRILMENIQFNDNMTDSLTRDTYIVTVNEAAGVVSHSDKPCVGTTSLSSCIGISLYDPERHVAAVTHVLLGPFTPVLEPVDQLLSKLLDIGRMLGGSSFRAQVFNAKAGQRTWNDQLIAHVDPLMARLVSCGEIQGFEHRHETNFILDSRNGSIYTGLN
jgi:hypothetical protein